MIARNDDAGGNDHFTPKKMIVVQPKEQPRVIQSGTFFRGNSASGKSSSLQTNNKRGGKGKGVWGACGVNEARTGMTATETITSIHVYSVQIHWWKTGLERKILYR